MLINKRINELAEERVKAQSWFVDQFKRSVSTHYDNRETSTMRTLSVETFIAYYEVLFNKKPSSVLDVGCGQGQIIKYLSERLPNLRLTGIDSSIYAIDSATKQNIEADFICTEIEAIHLHSTEKKYDVILIHLCFGLLKKPLEVLESLVPYMANESLIYIVDLNRDSIEEGITSAQSVEEKEYLLDQYNASFTVLEFNYLLELVTGKHNKLSYKIGTSAIGGFSQYSPEFLSLIGKRDLQQALRIIVEKDKDENKSMPDFLNAWIIKSC